MASLVVQDPSATPTNAVNVFRCRNVGVGVTELATIVFAKCNRDFRF